MRHMTKDIIKTIQWHMNRQFGCNLKVDGIFGYMTNLAILGIPNHKAMAQSDILERFRTSILSDRQIITTMIQLLSTIAGIDIGRIDGLWGQRTEHGFDILNDIRRKGRLSRFKRTDKNKNLNSTIEEQFGSVHYVKLDYVECPYDMVLAWDRTVKIRKFSANEKSAESMYNALDDINRTYSKKQRSDMGMNLFGGCYNKRKKRGSSEWSTHAWGISIDFDPARNRLRWNNKRARMAKSDFNDWWDIWEQHGFYSLGRIRNYDWMHLQNYNVG